MTCISRLLYRVAIIIEQSTTVQDGVESLELYKLQLATNEAIKRSYVQRLHKIHIHLYCKAILILFLMWNLYSFMHLLSIICPD